MMAIVVTPSLLITFNSRIILAALVASSPDVGSSRNIAIGAAASSIPMFTRFLCPPEITGALASPTLEYCTCVSCKHAISEST